MPTTESKSSLEANDSTKKPAAKKGKKAGKQDAQEIAGFLLSLKHSRSVSPEPGQDPSNTDQESDKDKEAAEIQQKIAEALAKTQAEIAIPMPTIMQGPIPAIGDSAMDLGTTEINFEALLDNSTLVLMKDRDLVPDALFVAMAQVKVCGLTQADRVGCYKTRDIGFNGMCCKHCGGQPGFGRYFPNSIRSLAQTTTSQTILKHIGNKCRFCPIEVRNAVLELQRQQAIREGLATGRPKYGSRKIFFQRVWARLHGGDEENSKSDETASLEDELNNNGEAKRKNRFGALPLMNKNKKIKIPDVVVHNFKAV